MRVKASIPSVEETEISATKNTTVAVLKNAICKKLGVEPEFSRLLVEGIKLRPDLKIGRLDLSGRKIVVDYLWARHLILWGKEGQRRLRRAKVLLIGAGAIGNEVAKNLAMLGVGRLTIVDFDVVELSNTSRMVFFDKSTVGQSKAKALAQAIAKKYPQTDTVYYDSKLESVPLAVYLDADVVVCGLDNVLSRIFLSTIGSRYRVPIVDGGILGYQARVQTYVPSESPCLACVFPRGQYGQLVGLKNPCDPPIEQAKTPSLPTTNSLVSAVQTQEVLKLIIGYPTFAETAKWPQETGEPIHGVWIADLRFGKYLVMPLSRNEKCMVCGQDGVGRDTVRRIEIPMHAIGTSMTSLKKAVLKIVCEESEDLQISMIGPEDAQKGKRAAKKRQGRMRAGDLLQVTFKSEQDKYKEMIVRLV